MAPFMHNHMPYHYQNNNRTPYATGNIDAQGCAPTAVSMAVSFLLGKDVSVNEIISWNDGRTNGRSWANTTRGQGGSYPDIVKGNATHYGLDYYYIPKRGVSYSDAYRFVSNALKMDMPIVVIVGNGYNNLFTSGEHYITLSGYQNTGGNNTIWVHNPNSMRHKTNEVQAHDFKKIWDLIPSTYGFYCLYDEDKYKMIYDRTYYLNHQKDKTAIIKLATERAKAGNGGKTPSQAQIDKEVFWHFIRFGVNEGRIASPYFDVKTYKSRYGDLQKAFGNDLPRYYAHYLEFGKNEGRFAYPTGASEVAETDVEFHKEFAKVFDADFYYNRHPDLQKAFGHNIGKLMMHYINYGMKEGRIASSQFNVNAYRKANPDLQKVYGNNLKNIVEHYFRFGCHEGRVCK